MGVEKKIALTPQLKAKASKLTLETKKKLIGAKITHLSKTKQEEYVRLKEMIEKKQAEKLARKKLKGEAEKENIERSNSLGEDEEAALRESLLNNMKKKVQSQENTTKGEKSKPAPQSQPARETKTMKIVENISVEIIGENRDVRIDNDDAIESAIEVKAGDDNSPESTKLRSLEKNVVG